MPTLVKVNLKAFNVLVLCSFITKSTFGTCHGCLSNYGLKNGEPKCSKLQYKLEIFNFKEIDQTIRTMTTKRHHTQFYKNFRLQQEKNAKRVERPPMIRYSIINIRDLVDNKMSFYLSSIERGINDLLKNKLYGTNGMITYT
jgi:hypothetical protein